MNTRQNILTLIKQSGDCHIGSCFSCVEIIEAIYDVVKPNDKFILSKAHASKVVDALGFIPQYVSELHCYGGSLGNGYGIGIGMAISNPDSNVYVLVGDGEMEEGSSIEAYNYHKNNRIDNLYVIVDNNNWQGLKSSKLCLKQSDPYVYYIDSMYNINGKYELDNNKFKSNLLDSLTSKSLISRVFVCNTIKGNGIRELEDTLRSHYHRMSDNDYERWMRELDA